MGKKKNCILLTPVFGKQSTVSCVLLSKKSLEYDYISGKEPTTYFNNVFLHKGMSTNKIVQLIGSDELQWSSLPYHKDRFPDLIMIFKRYKSWDPSDIGEHLKFGHANITGEFINKRHMIIGNVILFDRKKDMTQKYLDEILKYSLLDFDKFKLPYKKVESGLLIQYKSLLVNIADDEIYININESVDKPKRKQIKEEFIDFLIHCYLFHLEHINLVNAQVTNNFVELGYKYYQSTRCSNFSNSCVMKRISLYIGKDNPNPNYLWEAPKELVKTKDYDKLTEEQILLAKKNKIDFNPPMETEKSKQKSLEAIKRTSEKIKLIKEKKYKKQNL